jgi:hypothetical protein
VLVEGARGVAAESLFLRSYQSLTERGQKQLFESSTFIVLKLDSERMRAKKALSSINIKISGLEIYRFV